MFALADIHIERFERPASGAWSAVDQRRKICCFDAER